MYYGYNEGTKEFELKNSLGAVYKRQKDVGVLFRYSDLSLNDFGTVEEMSKKLYNFHRQNDFDVILVQSKDWDVEILNSIINKDISCEILNERAGFAETFKYSYFNDPKGY